MIIELSPDYDLFIKILFVFWVSIGFLKLLAGVLQADRPNRDKYGIIEVMVGGLVLMLALWVIS